MFVPSTIEGDRVELYVQGVSIPEDYRNYNFTATKKVALNRNNLLTFIQTDKPVYKPGQTGKATI